MVTLSWKCIIVDAEDRMESNLESNLESILQKAGALMTPVPPVNYAGAAT
jgi:hypothetical protein